MYMCINAYMCILMYCLLYMVYDILYFIYCIIFYTIHIAVSYSLHYILYRVDTFNILSDKSLVKFMKLFLYSYFSHYTGDSVFNFPLLCNDNWSESVSSLLFYYITPAQIQCKESHIRTWVSGGSVHRGSIFGEELCDAFWKLWIL